MRLILLAAALSMLTLGSAWAAGPVAGDRAPAFRLQDQNGDWHQLQDYQGQWLVMYFYPKDDTPGCTTEACAFRDDIFKFRKMGVALLGLSLDDVESHAKFAEKYHLPFPLLADTRRKAAKSYGVLRKFGPIKLANRETFVIDPQGQVAKRYVKVDPETHSAQLQADLAALMARAD